VHLAINRVATPLKLWAFVQGDAKDWFWMVASTVVFVYLAACLFMIYAHLYYKAGFATIADLMAS
jgi:hypothetical protein